MSVKAPGAEELRLAAAPAAGLAVKGECYDCGKWLPGERRYCGQCLRKRGRL